MIGLIFLAALGALIAAMIWLSGLITRRLPLSNRWKTFLRIVIVVGAFPLMLIDEIIGKYQFEALCKANGVESANISAAAGMRVKVKYGGRMLIDGTVMPIREGDVMFFAENSGTQLFKYKNYYARGGWIMRYTPVNMGYPQPMLFDGNGCGFRVRDRLFSEYKIVVIN